MVHFDRFWKLAWEKRAKQQDIVESGGRSVRGNWQELFQAITEDIISKMDFSESDNVLDIGCAGGNMEKAISPLVGRMIGIDYSVGMVGSAQENIRDFRNVRVLAASVVHLPFKNNYFTRIVCYSVFMYLKNIEEVKGSIREMIRVSAPSSRILIGDILDITKKPPLWSLSLLRAQKGKLDLIQFVKENIGHHLGLHLWLNPQELKSYIEGLGFKAAVLKQDASLQLSGMMFDLLIEVNK